MKMSFWKKLGGGFSSLWALAVMFIVTAIVELAFTFAFIGCLVYMLSHGDNTLETLFERFIENIDMSSVENIIESMQNLIYGLTFVADILTAIYLIVFYKRRCKYTAASLGTGTLSVRNVLLAIFAGMSAMLSVIFIFDITGYEKINTLSFDNAPGAIMLATALIAAPIAEELIFRGFVFSKMRDKGISFVFTVIFTSVIFGMIHGNPVQILYAGAFGLLLGLFRAKYDNLWLCMLMHCCANFAGSFPIAALGKAASHVIAYAAPVVLFICLILIFTDKSNKIKDNAEPALTY
ncbi:MAG TPA: CPBP family intramembrane metalloprotease [Bacillota bacterium]|nr:CPBP family intramembrane metalloprotease [Bacillota bacterium]